MTSDNSKKKGKVSKNTSEDGKNDSRKDKERRKFAYLRGANRRTGRERRTDADK